MKKWILLQGIVLLSLSAAGCRSSHQECKIAATSVPHADILAHLKPELEKKGFRLKILEIDDYNLPNRLLAEKQVDANFFQHILFLQEQKEKFGYPIEALVAVHIEPLGIYTRKEGTTLSTLRPRAKVAIPSDPTNESRALRLLAEIGLIELPAHCLQGNLLTIYDIKKNTRQLELIEIDAPFLARTLDDADLAVIPTNFALQAGLSPEKQALALEKASGSVYANIIAIREGEAGEEKLQALKEAASSESLKKYLCDTYHGAIVPVQSP